MISVCTSTYNNTPEQLARVWASLKAQTYTDWTWTVYDDSTLPDTWNILWGLCSDERYKIELFKPHVPSRGNIGLSKHNCFMLAKGDILVELDADDELTPDALAEIQAAFDAAPYAGFVYSNCAELLPQGGSGKYPEGWAFGYGSERWNDKYGVWEMIAPGLNRITLGHIVSVPNHVRAWRTDVYHRMGGHKINLPVADDYELIVRTYLTTRCVHIDKLLYLQHIGAHTAQRQRNALIQELVAQISAEYSDALDLAFKTPSETLGNLVVV